MRTVHQYGTTVDAMVIDRQGNRCPRHMSFWGQEVVSGVEQVKAASMNEAIGQWRKCGDEPYQVEVKLTLWEPMREECV